jgi:APA family basic amino acid/polyamine antiporter
VSARASRRQARAQYVLALILVAIGIVSFFITMLINRQLGIRDAGIKDPRSLGAPPD